jgi:hypothetical protein
MRTSTPNGMRTMAKVSRLEFHNWSGFQQVLPIMGILALASVLRFYQLGEESLWTDEVLSVRDTITGRGLPPQNLIRPLYYMLLRIWMVFGQSDAWMRGLSVIFGILSVYLIYRLGCLVANKATALLSAFMLACSPLAINHSQEVRMYMLSLCLGLAGSLIFISFLKMPTTKLGAWWLGLRLLAILSTPINLLLLIADGIIMATQFGSQRLLWRFKWWILTVCFLLTPIVIVLFDKLPGFFSKKQGATSPPNLRTVVGMLARLVVWPLDFSHGEISWFYDSMFDLFAVSIVGLMLLAILLAFRQHNKAMLWNAILAFVPLVGIFTVSHLTNFGAFSIPRYILFTSPYVILMAAYALGTLWQSHKKVCLLTFTLYLIVVASNLNYYFTNPLREDWRGAAQTILSMEQDGDAIATLSSNYQQAFSYYYGNTTINHLELDGENVSFELFSESLCNLQDRYSNFWLIFKFHGGQSEAKDNQIRSLVENNFEILDRQYFSGGIEIFYVQSTCR